jgi:thiol-disulfide isomerase/thioredoxin
MKHVICNDKKTFLRKRLASLVCLCCLFLLPFSTKAQEPKAVVENPLFSVAAQDNVIIEKIVITDAATKLYMYVWHSPKFWVRFASDTYIRVNGKKYLVTSAEGIELDKETYSDETNKTSFVLNFPPIDPHAKQLDFIESDCENCFKIWGVELQPKAARVRQQVPQDIRVLADIRDDGKPLEIPAFKSGKALLKGIFSGYQPEMNYTIQVYVDNPVTGIQEEYKTQIRDNGAFELNVPLVQSFQQVSLRLPSFNKYILLSPGKESSVYFDLRQKSCQEIKNDAIRCQPSRYIFFGGANSEINNQLFDDKVQQCMEGIRIDDKAMADINGMSAQQYKSYVLEQLQKSIDRVSALGLTKKAGEFAKIILRNEAAYLLMFANSYLESAFRQFHHLKWEDKLTGYDKPVLDNTYYSFIKDLGINDPRSLYSNMYGNNVNSVKYIGLDTYKWEDSVKDFYERLIASGGLSPEDKEVAEYQLRNVKGDWSPEKLRIAKIKNGRLAKVVMDSLKLDPQNQARAENLLRICADTTTSAKIMRETLNKFVQGLLEGGACTLDELNLLGAQANKGTTDNEKPEIDEKRLTAFNEKYKDAMSQADQKYRADQRLAYISGITGTSEGILFDLMTTQLLSHKLEEYTLIGKEDMETISKLKDPFYAVYLKEKNKELLAQIEANKRKAGYTIHEVPTTAGGEQVFDEMAKSFAGKVVLVDFWNTWCGPCRSAMKQMEPAKQALKEKGVVFVYFANQTSPLGTWHNMIADIPGEHYRLSGLQFEVLVKKFNISGIPSYLILNKEGKQVYFKTGFEGKEKMVGMLQNELNK